MKLLFENNHLDVVTTLMLMINSIINTRIKRCFKSSYTQNQHAIGIRIFTGFII